MFRFRMDRNFAIASAVLVAATCVAGCLTEPPPASINIPQVSGRILGGAGTESLNGRGVSGSNDPRSIFVEAPAPDSVSWVKLDVLQSQTAYTFHVVAALGGTYHYGRYTLFFPPSAIAEDGDVTITVPDPAVISCDLSIRPARLNSFSQPVVLTMNVSGTDMSAAGIDSILAKRVAVVAAAPQALRRRLTAQAAQPPTGPIDMDPAQSPVGIYWEGPTGWVNRGAKLDPNTWYMSINLQHFSHYRAGW